MHNIRNRRNHDQPSAAGAIASDEAVDPGKQRLDDLTLMDANGWGDFRQDKLPVDWRTRKNPAKSRHGQ